jgi:hypothetical protein
MRHVGGVMSLMSVEAAVVPLVEDYLQIISWGMPSVCLYFVCRFLCEGTGNARPMMLIQLVVLPINIFLSWILIFGRLGFRCSSEIKKINTQSSARRQMDFGFVIIIPIIAFQKKVLVRSCLYDLKY